MRRVLLTACIWMMGTVAHAQVGAFWSLTSTQLIFHEPIQLLYVVNWPGHPSHLAERVWHSLDLKQIDPRFASVAAIDVEGILTITGNNDPATLCQIKVQFRRPGSAQAAGNYQWQHITDGGWSYRVANGGSIRKPVPSVERPFKRVGLTQGVVEFWWATEPSCSSGVNLKIASVLLP